MFMIFPKSMIRSVIAVGRIPGIMICQMILSLFAPSIFAASISCGSILVSVARYMMELYPEFCHIPEIMYMGLNHSGLLAK